MIKAFEVKNLFGYSYFLGMKSGHRAKNSVHLKGEKLFTALQVSKEVDTVDYRHVFNGIAVLKHVHKTTFKKFCTDFLDESETSIQIEFYNFDSNTNTYIPCHYYICMNNTGILEEIIDGQPVLDSLRKTPFHSNMPVHFTDYFELMMMYDVSDRLHRAELRTIFFEAIEMPTYRKFLIKLLQMCGEGLVNIYKDDKNSILVKYKDESLIAFDDEDEEFRVLCLISWVCYITLIKSGPIVLHHLDAAISTNNIRKLVLLFSEGEELGFNKSQLIFSAFKSEYSLYPEQKIQVIEEFNTRYCTWQNF